LIPLDLDPRFSDDASVMLLFVRLIEILLKLVRLESELRADMLDILLLPRLI